MKAGILVSALFACALALPTVTVAAAQSSSMTAMMDSQIYGNQLMSDYERAQYRAKMRNAGSSAQKLQIQKDHQKLMQERAKQRGYKLRSAPPVKESPRFKTAPKKQRPTFDRNKRSKFKRNGAEKRSPFDRSRRR